MQRHSYGYPPLHWHWTCPNVWMAESMCVCVCVRTQMCNASNTNSIKSPSKATQVFCLPPTCFSQSHILEMPTWLNVPFWNSRTGREFSSEMGKVIGWKKCHTQSDGGLAQEPVQSRAEADQEGSRHSEGGQMMWRGQATWGWGRGSHDVGGHSDQLSARCKSRGGCCGCPGEGSWRGSKARGKLFATLVLSLSKAHMWSHMQLLSANILPIKHKGGRRCFQNITTTPATPQVMLV